MDIGGALNAVLGLGSEAKDLRVGQVCLRGVVVFAATIVLVRVAHKRFLARMSALDAVLGFVLASALARAINGSAPFVPTLVMGLVLVLIHRMVTIGAFCWPRFRHWVEGGANILVKDGRPDRKAMRKHGISEDDLLEEARLRGRVSGLPDIQTATLERSGHISIVPREKGG